MSDPTRAELTELEMAQLSNKLLREKVAEYRQALDAARTDRDRLAALLREAVHELRRIENEARRESIPESSDAWYVAEIGEGDMECIRVLLARIAQGGE